MAMEALNLIAVLVSSPQEYRYQGTLTSAVTTCRCWAPIFHLLFRQRKIPNSEPAWLLPVTILLQLS